MPPTPPIITTTGLTRTNDWVGANSVSVQDLLFQMAGVILGVATLGVAYFQYRHWSRSRGGGEELESDEAPSPGMLPFQTMLEFFMTCVSVRAIRNREWQFKSR